MEIWKLFLSFSLFLQMSIATLFSFSNSCGKLKSDYSPDNQTLTKCTNLLDDNDQKIRNHLTMLHNIYELKFSELILIISDDMRDAISLARLLSSNNIQKRKKNRQNIANDQLMTFDFILNNIHLYENPSKNWTLFVLPQQTMDDNLAGILAHHIVKSAESVKIILTTNTSSKNANKKIQKTFNTAGKFFRNPKNYQNSVAYFLKMSEQSKPEKPKNEVFKETVKITREKFVEICKNLMINAETDVERQLTKFVINDREKKIIIGTELIKKDFANIDKLLNNMVATKVNRHDLQNQQILYLDCLNNLANDQLTILMTSLKLGLISEFTSQNSSEPSTLTGIFTLAEKLNQTSQSLSGFFECTKTDNITKLSQCFQNVSQQLQEIGFKNIDITSVGNYYLEIFCDIQTSSFMILPIMEYSVKSENWMYDLKKYFKSSLVPTNDWYQKLTFTFNNVHQMSKEEIEENLKNHSNQLSSDKASSFHDLNTAKIAHEIIKSNAIKMEATFKFLRIENVMKLQVRGKFLKLSEILKNNWFVRRNFKILEIFALEKIIIDDDLIADGNGLDVFIFSPVWEILNRRRIVLDGVDGNQLRGNLAPKAKNGNKMTNPNGVHGQAGVPGSTAGTFFGFAETIINVENLHISLNGGNGSDGQSGGDAADGEDGETPSAHFLIENLSRHPCAWPRNNQFMYQIERPTQDKFHIPLVGAMIVLKYKPECYIFGLDGYPGGHGGNGGVSGKGGRAGMYKLFPFDDSSKFGVELSVANGTDGKGGSGGMAGKGGFTWKVTFTNYDYFDYAVTKNETYIRAMDGQEGIGNSSIIGTKLISYRPITQSYGQTANLYKRYILEMFHSDSNGKYIDLYKKVINNGHILKEYDTLTLVEEYIDLEQHYYRSSNKTQTLFLYQAWKKRLEHYSKNRKPNEKSNEYDEVLRSLQSTVSNKITRLLKNSQNYLIFLLADYLTQTQQQVQHLHNAKTVMVIKKTNKKYTDEYDDKIEEAQRIIQDDLQTNLTQNNEELSGEMEMLLRRIAQLANMEAKKAEELVKKSSSMQEKVVLQTFNDILGLLNTGLGFINPALATIGTKISAAGSIVQNFIDDTADTNIEIMIPNMVDRSRKFFDNWTSMKKEFQKLAIDENLKMMRSNRLDLISKGKNVEPLEKMEKTFEELRNQLERRSSSSSTSSSSGDIIANINEKLEQEENLWQQLDNNRKKIYTESLKVINHLKTYTRLKQMLGDVLTKCEDLKNPKNIDGVSEQIEKAFIKTRRLRNFKDEVLAKMIPLLMKIRETTNVDNLHSSSVAFLDFKNFQMQQYFEKVFNQIGDYARDFKLESYFEKTLKKMQSVVQMVISTYTRIEEYVTTMRNANYETDLYLAPFDVTYLKDPKLSMSLAKMIQESYANIVLDDYTKWMASFKQYIFPFADELMGVYESSIPEVDDLIIRAQDAAERLEVYGSRINKKRAELREFENTVTTIFGYSLPPFHVWSKTNKKHKNDINSLLSGKRITLHANITEHENLNAVKFSDIWLRLTSEKRDVNEKLKIDLKGFAFSLKHHGDSYYRCDERIFLIRSEIHRAEKIFNDEKLQYYDDNMKIKIIPMDKVKSDCILSPYATWSIKIISRDVNKNFTVLEKYKSKIDLELVGLGQYSDKNLNICQTNLRKYYENELYI